MNLENRRKQLFKYLDHVLAVSDKKFSSEKRGNGERLKWGRLICDAVGKYGSLLKDEELEVRVRALEEKFEHAVLIPNEFEKTNTRSRR